MHNIEDFISPLMSSLGGCSMDQWCLLRVTKTDETIRGKQGRYWLIWEQTQVGTKEIAIFRRP